MGGEAFIPLILAALGAVSASGLAAGISAATGRLLKGRTANVEGELIESLGLADSTHASDRSKSADSSTNSDGIASDSGNTETAGNGHKEGRSRFDQNIFLNFGNEKEAAETLADVVRQQSDGHTRLIVKYYAQGYQQAFVSFLASLAFAVVGFGVIITACIYLLLHPAEPEPAAISGAAGLVTQGVGYLFFRRADKARELMLGLIDKLREDRDQEIRFIAGLASTSAIKSSSLRDAVKVAAALTLTGVTMTPGQVESLATHASSSAPNDAPRVHIHAPVPTPASD
ncbi:hypothetical protein AB0J94_22740 [Micromonospora noduli]|uniref:TRADD-N-associated membrane domain-containing protein n=1 Tax=Micromonospora noduli TaxID=709876 RepID=UPI0034488344